MCGTTTVQMLNVLRRQSGSGPGVASVRETELVRHAATLQSLRIVVGQFGGLSSLGRSISKALRHEGATVMSTDEYEAAAQASAANRFGATLYVGFEARTDPCCDVLYFAVPTFESVGGRSLGAHIANAVNGVLPAPAVLRGMRLPVLRETRMPAVLCCFGPVREVVDANDELSRAVLDAVGRWTSSPLPVPDVHHQSDLVLDDPVDDTVAGTIDDPGDPSDDPGDDASIADDLATDV